MDPQALQVILVIGQGILTIAGGVVGWVVKGVTDRQTKLEDRLNGHIEKTSDIYATKVDVNRQFDRVVETLDRIEDKLEKKWPN